MLRRVQTLFLVLLLLFPSGAFAGTLPKYPPIPDILRVSMKEKETKQKNGSIINVFYPTTANDAVNKELTGIITGYIDQIAPGLPEGKKRPEESKLEIRCIYSLTGESWLSFMILARTVYHRDPVKEEITTRTYDIASGKQILLTDIFPEDSPAWAVLGDAVKAQLNAYFPQEKADEAALSALCTKEALKAASFTLGAVKMELHYPASILYPSRATLMHVKVYYRDLAGMMTAEAALQTDNSRYPMIALTFDDGPQFVGTVDLLDALQMYGAKATFFLIGDQMERYKDVVQKQHDEGHTVASHTWNHYDPRNMTVEESLGNRRKFDELLSNITGTTAPFMRAPGGRYQEFVKMNIGLPLIQWSVISSDITTEKYRRVVDTVVGNARHGGIVLLHDTRKATIKGAKQMLSYLQKKGFLCVTVEDLFVMNNMEMLPDTVYRDANGWIETDGLTAK